MPKPVLNQALQAAGFAPRYPELSYNHPDLALLRDAIEIILNNHMPFPAMALDHHWSVIEANASA